MDSIPDKKILAHRVVHQGVAHKMAVAEIASDGRSVAIAPFERECAGTVFVPGTVEVVSGPDGQLHFHICTSTSSSNSRK